MLRRIVGAVVVVLGAAASYAAWVLARRTVFDYAYLGFWGVVTGVVLVGVLLAVAFAGVVALSRGYLRLVEGGSAFEAVERRRAEASRRLTSPPLARVWRLLVALGVVLWAILFVFPEAVNDLSPFFFEASAVAAWVVVPVAVYLNSRARSDEPSLPPRRVRVYVVGSLFPFLAAVFGALYLVRTALVLRGKQRAQSSG